MALSDFLTAIRRAPIDGQQLNKDEAKLLAERKRVPSVPHIDDVVAKVVGGLRKRAADAEARLTAYHLNAESMAATPADTIDNDAVVFDLLALTSDKPHPANSGDPKRTATIFPQGFAPDSGMLTYLLLPQMEKAGEQLVRERLTDACKGGMRLSERRAKLADIDTKLAAIRKQRAELIEGLREATRHIEGAPEAIAKGATDADVAAEVAEYERQTGERIVGAQ
jgi:hypothetical protein